ncbi:MAG: hypothetical protein ACREMB_13110 [Candidatus Rokuibacteriota bacterium]
MKRVVAGLAVLVVTAVAVPPGWAQNVDPLHIGEDAPRALEGSYSTNAGQLQFLFLTSPLTCNDGSDPDQCPFPLRVYFYNTACNRVDSRPVSLGPNQTTVLELHNPGVTANRAGNFLVAAADPTDPGLALLTEESIAGISYFFDANTGIARAEELSRLARNGWLPFNAAAAILLAVPDDGVSFSSTLRLRCPVGTAVSGSDVIGTLDTLGGDMLDLAAQEDGETPGDAFLSPVDDDTLRDDNDSNFNGTFASAVTATVYDLDGNLLGTVASIPCTCLTEVGLGTLTPLATSQFTYWELFSTGGDLGTEIFTGAFSFQAGPGLAFNHRLHHTRDEDGLLP